MSLAWESVLGPLCEGAVERKRDWGREFKSFILSLRRGVKKTCRWHVFSPDLGGYAAVAATSLAEGGKETDCRVGLTPSSQ